MRGLADGPGIKHQRKWSPSGQQLAFLVSDYYGDKPAIHIVGANDGAVVCNQPNKEGRGIWKLDWEPTGNALMLSYFAGGPSTWRLDARPSCGAVQTLRKGARPLLAQAGDGSLVWNDANPVGPGGNKMGRTKE